MPRVYKKKPGSRNYENYSKETLEKCLAEVKNGLPIVQASKKFGIHRNTISNKIRGKHTKPKGNDCLILIDFWLRRTLKNNNMHLNFCR